LNFVGSEVEENVIEIRGRGLDKYFAGSSDLRDLFDRPKKKERSGQWI
jgi:hypothetical protein